MEKTCGTDNIVLTFEAKATGDAHNTLASANIDKVVNANTQDIIAATIKKANTTFTIGGYKVDFSDDFTDPGTVDPNADATFAVKELFFKKASSCPKVVGVCAVPLGGKEEQRSVFAIPLWRNR